MPTLIETKSGEPRVEWKDSACVTPIKKCEAKPHYLHLHAHTLHIFLGGGARAKRS